MNADPSSAIERPERPERPSGTRRVRFSVTLPAPAEWVAAQLQSTAVFRHITAPLLRFAPSRGPWPAHWAPGALELRLSLFGLLPLGRQTAQISVSPGAAESDWPRLRDNGHGQLMRRWDHRITLQSLPDGTTRYTDEVVLQARHLPWLMTPLSAAFAQLFYRHRQRRWRQLAQQHTNGHGPIPPWRRQAFEHLLAAFGASAGQPLAKRWLWLEAAHVLGQPLLGLHWRSHLAMLRLAFQQGQWREVWGQGLRLALVPLGHVLQRLPAGNTGRAQVNFWRPMPPSAPLTEMMDAALAATQPPSLTKIQAKSASSAYQ